jgi:hypothetical protein
MEVCAQWCDNDDCNNFYLIIRSANDLIINSQKGCSGVSQKELLYQTRTAHSQKECEG